MTTDDLFGSLEGVAAHLPFGLYETDRVNEAYEDWVERGDPQQKRVVEVWTYCFVRRYVLVKFALEHAAQSADVELVVDRIYRKIEQKRSTLSNPRRYAGWVSVVCKNAYLNYRRSFTRTTAVGTGDVAVVVAEPAELAYDNLVLLDALHAAIERLPTYLQEVATLRFVQDLAYDEIAERIGQPVAIVRSYVSKVVCRLREDEILKKLLRPDRSRSGRTVERLRALLD